MFLVGGYLGLAVGLYSNIKKRYVKYPFDVLVGASLITFIEFVSGCILNLWLGFNIWDYSKSAFNLLGQIDYIHSICWILITPLIFWLDDVIRHYMFNEHRPVPLINFYIGRY